MKKEFYNYLLKKLVKYFDENLTKVGERYYLQLDEQEQVDEFYSVLSQYEKAESFIYESEVGEAYKTIYIDINGIKLVVAATVNNTTPAYLVRVRNCSSEQVEGWEKTAIFVLCGEPLDSIKGGCKDLRRDGMPFNVKSISQNLKTELENSDLSKTDKEVSKFYVEQKLSDLYNTSLWDYQEILSIINKKEIEMEDYKKIGLFKDTGLEELNSKQIKTRLKENHEFFEKVLNVQEYEDKKTQLEKDFDDKGVSLLSKDTWAETEFNKVKASNENNKKQDRPLKYQGLNNKKDKDGVIIWEREKADTAAGRRVRNILVFNDNSDETVKLEFLFDDKLTKNDIKAGQDFAKISGDKLIIELQGNKLENKFCKVTYKHKNQNKSKYDFNIGIVNIESSTIEKFKGKYEVIIDKKGKGKIRVNNDNEGLEFGCGLAKTEVEVNEAFETVEIPKNTVIKISSYSNGWQDEKLEFKIKDDKGTLDLEAIEEMSRIKPINSLRIWKKKREKAESFILEENRVRIDTSEFYIDEKLKETLLVEKEIILGDILYGEKKIGLIEKKDIKVSEKLENAYRKIIEYYKKINNIPSLTYINDELENLYREYVEVFNGEIESIKEAEIIANDREKLNLLKLGSVIEESKVIMTALSPINIAYQLEAKRQLESEEVEAHILERLRVNNLLPYLYSEEGKLLRPIYQKENIEWIVFDKSENVSIGETNAFVSKVVKEKMVQFINHFKYLFIASSKAPIKINLINIKNDKEVVRGVFEYIKEQIFKKTKIIPVEIRIYNNAMESAFDEFFSYKSIERLEEEFDIKLENKGSDLDKVDVIRLALENIKYYKFENSGDYEYAHVAFYKIGQDEKYAKDTMSNMETGLALNGIISNIASNNNPSNYRSGFGSKDILDKEEILARTSMNINELASNLDNYGENPYRKDQSIVTKPLMIDEKSRERLYDSAHWVTFIEPNFGLEYFENNNSNELIVIHYSDQYTSSDQYDTITVTNKSEQYIYIIEEFLKKKEISINDEEASKIIKSFNSINGEWLLNLIANKSEFDREKLSIISAIKYGLAILNHKDIIWLPVSLEEILRVSNAVKLNKSDGLFTLKNLNRSGVHSDDLIFIGVNIKDLENLKIYYYPVEVKIGYNFEAVIEKGMVQIDQTYKLIREQLYGENGESFKNKFFRNFFIQLLIANEQKFTVNGLWKEKEIERIELVKKYLLNDKYTVSFEIEKFIGKGALISFKKDNHWRSANLEDDKFMIELTENDAYYGIKKDINEIYDEIAKEKSDLNKANLLEGKELTGEESRDMEKPEVSIIKEEVAAHNEIINNEVQPIIVERKKLSNASIVLGEVEGTSREVSWEFGDKELSNRHMLITGKSGQGKTYFIQCALKELIDNGIPAIIIDYTEGFKLSQLESEFKEYLGERLENYIVARDKFPLNPFALGQKELDENEYMSEEETDVAERFKSIIGSVYKDLGAQQLNTIYEAVIRGFEMFGGRLSLSGLRQVLEEEDSNYAKSILGQIRLLLDKNPFRESEEFNWSRIDEGNGKLFIIQLSGFTKEIQKVITEIILWDLWNYKLQHGSKDKPFAVILDECQNLDFKDSSPSTKILTEGRKFGWSAWFATQFLRGQMDKATISRLQNSGQKIYFAQTEEEAAGMSSSLAVDNDEKKKWAKELINLKKGQCISYGLIKCEDGTILSKPVKIKIKSLTKRIKK